MPNDMYRLIVRRGPEPNRILELNKDVMTLGRDITNDIVLNDPEVSRQHVRFTQGAHGYNIEDLGSTNGTFVAGQRISGVRPLNPGETVGLGATVTLSYEVARATPAVGPGSPTVVGTVTPQPPSQPEPYAPPSPRSPVQQPPFSPRAQPEYAQPPEYPPQQPDYYAEAYPPQQPEAEYGTPPQIPPDYEYDPYAAREEEPRSMLNWVLIGCAVLFFFCCCCSTVGLFVVDQTGTWEDIPIFKDTVTPLFRNIGEALGIVVSD